MASDGGAPSAGGPDPLVRVAGDDGVTVVWVAGEHDLATTSVLRTALASTDDGNDSDMVVDLSGVTFIDASIVRVLEEARARMDGGSARLVLRDPSPLVRRVLTLCAIEFEGAPDGGGDHVRQEART
jgi:anti-sigma B factor antagonist